MRRAYLSAVVLLGAVMQGFAQPYTIPIYVNAGDFSPTRYTIYAGVGDGAAMRPYLFDTGSPNMFTVVGGGTGTATANFSFSSGATYNYFVNQTKVTLGTSGNVSIVSTGPSVNVATVVSITSNGTTTPTNGNELSDNTFGNFSGGLYGNSTLATILPQIPLAPGLLPGWSINVAGLDSGSGNLTIGLTPEAIQAAKNTPGAITMQMSPSGNFIPTATGQIAGYDKAQVGGTTVVLDNGVNRVEKTLPTVFDTGGGPNVMIYDEDFLPAAEGNVTISYGGATFLSYNGTTPFGGRVIVDGNPALVDGEPRVNPGGAAIYYNYEVVFALDATGSEGELILVPGVIPEPSTVALLALCAVGVIFLRRKNIRAMQRGLRSR